MPTCLQLVDRSMRLARVIGKDESIDADEAEDGRVALNAMLDSWQLDRLYVYQIQEDSFTWSATQSRTVGSSGNFVLAAPARVDESSYFRVNSVDYQVDFLSQEQWAAIPDKSSTSTIPEAIYVEYGTTTHTLYAYPTPSASITFLLRSWQALQSFAATTTDLALPMGYERAIVYSLAEEFCAEFGKDVPARVSLIAKSARRSLKRINLPKMTMATEVAYMVPSLGRFNINTG